MYRAVVVGLVLGACQSNVHTPFPAGLEPLEDNPVAVQDAPYSETLAMQSETNDYMVVYGVGYVLLDPGTVWAMVKDPQAMVALCSTTTQTITPDDEPQYEFSFLVDYVVNNIVTVEWDDAWRYGTITGTEAEPTLAMIKHQKTDGSSFIKLSEGTIELTPTPDDPNVTEVSIVEHLNAVGSTLDNLVAGVNHTYASIVAVSHGNPVPACP